MVLLTALVTVSCGVVISDTPPTGTSVLLICWDGVKQDHLFSLLSEGRTPNAARLMVTGGLFNLTVDGHATETTPGHVEMLTGYPSNITGALNNLEYSVIPVNLTIFERLEGSLGDDRIVTVMLTGKPLVVEYITDPSQYEVINWTMNETHPFYNARLSIDCLDLNRANATVVGGKAINYLDACRNETFFMFFHFRDPDFAGHNFGENSEEYDDAIVECDRWLGVILSTMESLGICDRATVYVTTDHGFDEGGFGHSYAPEIWLLTNDPCINMTTAGHQGDIVPTILTKFGIDPASFSPQLPGSSLTAPPPAEGGGIQAWGLAILAVAAVLCAVSVAAAFFLRKKRRVSALEGMPAI